MNKKLSTLIFILAGTVLNIILMILFIASLVLVSNALLRGLGYDPSNNSNFFIITTMASILGGMVLAFIAYNKITKYIQKKYDLEKYLEPIFKKSRR